MPASPRSSSRASNTNPRTAIETRSAYIGSELFLSLVDPQGAPYNDELRQIAVSALVTQRDLPTLLPGTPNGEINDGSYIVTDYEDGRFVFTSQ